MERMLSSDEQQRLVSYFLEIAVGQTSETARQCLQAANWKITEAIQLYYFPNHNQLMSNHNVAAQSRRAVTVGNSQHQPTSLVAFSPSASASAPQPDLASIYCHPFHLMFHGTFEQAKATSSSQDKWLLVHLQSLTGFSAIMLNKKTWANETVSQIIKANFIFWQAYDDTPEGRKFCAYYKLKSVSSVLLINPTTGQEIKTWCRVVELEPQDLIVDLLPFMDCGPREHFASLSKTQRRCSFSLIPHSKPKEELQRSLAVSLDDYNIEESSDDQSMIMTKEVAVEAVTTAVLPPTFPPLPEEPKGENRSVECRVRICLPNGHRIGRVFLRTDPIQLLWSFYYSHFEESERKKPLKLTKMILGGSKAITLEYESNLTLEQSGVADCLIFATWE